MIGSFDLLSLLVLGLLVPALAGSCAGLPDGQVRAGDRPEVREAAAVHAVARGPAEQGESVEFTD